MKGRIENSGPGYGRCRPCQSRGNPVENAMRFPPASHRSLEKPSDLWSLPFPQGLENLAAAWCRHGFPTPPTAPTTTTSPKKTGRRQKFQNRWKQKGIGLGRGHF
jgi:hypothetical protein